jgi:hypothetical protein
MCVWHILYMKIDIDERVPLKRLPWGYDDEATAQKAT